MRKVSDEIDFKVGSRLHKHVGVEGATSKVLVQLKAGPAKFAWDPRGTRNCGRLWPNGATRWTMLPNRPLGSFMNVMPTEQRARKHCDQSLSRDNLVPQTSQLQLRGRCQGLCYLLGPIRMHETHRNQRLFSSITNKQQIHFHSFYPYTRFGFLS